MKSSVIDHSYQPSRGCHRFSWTLGQARLALHQDARQPWNGRVGWNCWAQAFLRRCIGFWAAFPGFQMAIMAIMKLCMLFCWIRCRPCCWFQIYVWACLVWVTEFVDRQNLKKHAFFWKKKREHKEFYNAGKTIINHIIMVIWGDDLLLFYPPPRAVSSNIFPSLWRRWHTRCLERCQRSSEKSWRSLNRDLLQWWAATNSWDLNITWGFTYNQWIYSIHFYTI